jgi:hypothetical protein
VKRTFRLRSECRSWWSGRVSDRLSPNISCHWAGGSETTRGAKLCPALCNAFDGVKALT